MEDLIELNNSGADFLKEIPKFSGIYKFLDLRKEVLYIGKAKNLSNRINSYFSKTKGRSKKIDNLISQATFLNITLTNNELEAMLLEQHQIKKFRPKYNVVFKDDKGYPWIKIDISKEFPSVTSFRGKEEGTDLLFGPYPSSYALKEVMEIIQKVFKLRNCSETFFKNRSRPCIQAEIGRCSAPCVGEIDKKDYLKEVESVKKLLKGKSEDLIKDLYLSMDKKSKKQDYEKAALYRNKISALREIQRNQSSAGFSKDVDAISFAETNKEFRIGLTQVRGGWITGHRNFSVKGNIHDDNILEIFLLDHYINKANNLPKTIVLKETIKNKRSIEQALSSFHNNFSRIITRPTKKDKGLLEISLSNTKFSLRKAKKKRNLDTQFCKLNEITNLGRKVNFIDCIDISHHSGKNAIGGCVVYSRKGRMKDRYRLYNISETNSGDDINSMIEVVRRRYTKLVNNKKELPELLLLDGGQVHLKNIKKELNSIGLSRIKILAISKGVRRKGSFDSIHTEDRSVKKIDSNSISHLLIQEIRDEAHRFVINSQRYKYLKSASKSSLDNLPGIGRERKKSLIRYFGSVDQIERANVNDLKSVEGIGIQLAKEIHNFFHYS